MENTEGEGNPLDVLAPGKRKVLHIQVGLAAGHTVGNNGSSFFITAQIQNEEIFADLCACI